MKKRNTIPLFPLHTVLFPGQMLPLQIFEPRYIIMIKECLANDSTFGVVLIRQGFEVGSSADPYPIGTTARIKQVDQAANGLIDLICVGEQRFQIRSLSHERPYLSGEIEYWPWMKASNAETEPSINQIQDQLTGYLETLTRLTGSTIQMGSLPSDPKKLTHLAAIALRVSNQEKQELLTTANLQELMDRCVSLLRRENCVLKTLAAIPDPTLSVSHFYSPN